MQLEKGDALIMNRKKILIIDDEDDFCFFVKLNLQKTGKYQVFTATSGMEGISLARQLKPDFIFLDMVMPKMGGTEVAKTLLEDESTRIIPFVFVSAVMKNYEIAKCGGHIGARDFIAKPVTPEKLIEKIEQMLMDHYCSLVQSCVEGPSMLMCFFTAQHMLLVTLFSATLFLASISVENAASASSDATQVTVSAKVLARSNLKMLHHVPAITITGTDIRRGYIDMKSAARMEIKSNKSGGLSLIFQGIAWPFREIHVKGLANESQISPGNTFVYQSYNHGTITIELDYRLFFIGGAKPGIYDLPRIIGEFF